MSQATKKDAILNFFFHMKLINFSFVKKPAQQHECQSQTDEKKQELGELLFIAAHEI